MKRNPYLRVKLKSLAEEARIIRIEELRANKARNFDLQNGLRGHRVATVRRATRETLLAYQFLRGVPYAKVEKPNSNPVDLLAVLRMVKRYGDLKSGTEEQALKEWMEPREEQEVPVLSVAVG